jgi:hypothetical protein
VLGMAVLTPINLLIEWQDNGGLERWSTNSQPGVGTVGPHHRLRLGAGDRGRRALGALQRAGLRATKEGRMIVRTRGRDLPLGHTKHASPA